MVRPTGVPTRPKPKLAHETSTYNSGHFTYNYSTCYTYFLKYSSIPLGHAHTLPGNTRDTLTGS